MGKINGWFENMKLAYIGFYKNARNRKTQPRQETSCQGWHNNFSGNSDTRLKGPASFPDLTVTDETA